MASKRLLAAWLLPVLSAFGVAQLPPSSMRLTWPTPNTAYLEGRPNESYIQPTGTGLIESGLFGCVRNSGTRFHEGIDLLPIALDRSGEALDPIVSVADGLVRYICHRPGDGGYGRYVVVEHPDLVPAVYTLYAHLSSIADGLGMGTQVQRGQKLGIMGRSAGGYSIPKDRAHLHFEIGLRLSDSFDPWYRQQGFGSPNRHGAFNGMNLVGFDPLDFFNAFGTGRVGQPLEYIAGLPVAVTVRVSERSIPDFVRRYPMLVEGGVPLAAPDAWDVDFTAWGMPTALRPVSRGVSFARSSTRWEILERKSDVSLWRCQKLLVSGKARRGVQTWSPGKDLRENLELMFGAK
jgi:peptidoglycan LD-endopeptidase LytH